jgi:dihydrofolate reductase
METVRKVVIKCAMSLDGYIAKPNDDISFLSLVQKPGQDYGYGEFIKTIDTVIIGRKTYDTVVRIGHKYQTAKQVYVITRTARPDNGYYKFYTGDPHDLVLQLKKETGKNIYCDGGAEIINELLSHKLIDEFNISIVPILLGNGVALFGNGRPEQKLKLITAQQFDTGLTQLHYQS